MYDRAKRIAAKLDIKVEDAVAHDDKGNPKPILVIHHGKHKLIAVGTDDYLLVGYPMDLSDEDAAALAALPADVQNRLQAIIRREMLEGRSGFAVLTDGTKKPAALRRISVEQKIVTMDESSQTLQRFADGIQELVVVATRCRDVLGQALKGLREGQTSADTYHPGMYA